MHITWRTLIPAALLLVPVLAGAPAAQASESTMLAENGGYLLGHAHRCGVANERLVRAGRIIGDLIIAAATDSEEENRAKLLFGAVFAASARPDDDFAVLVPPCKTVVGQFERLERHHRQSQQP
jgi:hypothetical protein